MKKHIHQALRRGKYAEYKRKKNPVFTLAALNERVRVHSAVHLCGHLKHILEQLSRELLRRNQTRPGVDKEGRTHQTRTNVHEKGFRGHRGEGVTFPSAGKYNEVRLLFETVERLDRELGLFLNARIIRYTTVTTDHTHA